MNPIIKILKDLDVNEDKIKELFVTLTSNPLMVMGVVQQLGLPAEKMQEIMGIVMTSPGIIKEAVEELGLDFGAVEKAKEALKNSVS